MTPRLPQSLINAVKNDTLIPFVGAGISTGVKDTQNKRLFKSWTNSLLDSVEILRDEKEEAKANRIESGLEIQPVDYLDIASEIHKYLNSHWNKYLTSTFDKDFTNINQDCLLIPKEILKLNNLVITTNYDNVLNWSYNNTNKDLIEWDKKALYGQVDSLKKNPNTQTIWYLHGKISNPDDIVFTKESYEETYKEDSAPIEILKSHLLTKSFIFCGFSLDDPYIKMQLEKIKVIFGTNLSKHYMIIQKGRKQDFSYLGDIQFLEVDDYDTDYLALLQEINSQKTANPTPLIETSFATDTKKQFFNVPFESKRDDVVGIEGKIEEIHEKLNTSKNLRIGQVAKFEGMGGLGKTQLAVEYAHKYKDAFENGILWLTMDQDLDEQLLTFAKEYNLVNQNLDIKEQLDGIKYQLKSFENMLLIYDNVTNQEDIDQEFLPKSRTNKILITTRNPMHGYTAIELETLNFENSKKLLEIESDKNILDSEIVSVKELCEKLDGLPLALEMAGAYVKHLNISWDKYLDLYNKQSIKLLDKSKLPESFTEHENNIASTLTISQNIIDETAKLKEILNLLSYGANEPIDDELICRLLSCDESDIIEAISIGIKLKYIKKSTQGYTIHRLLKEVWKSQEKLEQTFIDDVAKNLSSYIHEIKDEFLNLSKLEKANLFSEQWINYLEDNDTKAILIAYRAYLDFYKGHFEKALEIVMEADRIIEKKDSLEYAEILTYQGTLNRVLKKELHLSFHIKCYEMRKRLFNNQDHSSIASSLSNLGISWKEKDFEKALNFSEQSYQMRKRLFNNQDHPDTAISLLNLGYILNKKDFEKALNFYEQSYQMRKRLFDNQDHPDIGGSLNELGAIWARKDFNKSLTFLKQSYEMRKRLFSNQYHPDIILSMFNLSTKLCESTSTKKEGVNLLKEYKKIVTKKEDKEKIKNLLKQYDNVGRNKSNRKKDKKRR